MSSERYDDLALDMQTRLLSAEKLYAPSEIRREPLPHDSSKMKSEHITSHCPVKGSQIYIYIYIYIYVFVGTYM